MNERFMAGIDEIIDQKHFENAANGHKKLRIKLGVDPSSPDIHLGHAVVLRKLRALQEMGHVIIFLIGDYTARIGDPSGKNKTRPILTDDEISANATTYLEQVGKILDMEKVEVRRNSEWLSKLSFADLIKLTSDFSVAQIIEREDFRKRLDEGTEVSLHEILYPVMQAYDSVALEADVEFGGTDQRFNLFAGRALMKKMGMKPQDIVMTQLLVGTDGVHKMSKSLGNFIGILDDPNDMFGKIMSVPDSLIGPYYDLCTDIDHKTIQQVVADIAAGANPRDTKASLAREIVRLYHGDTAALSAGDAFDRRFKDKQLAAEDRERMDVVGPVSSLVHEFLAETHLTTSKSEARRLIEQGGVRINDVILKSDDVHDFKTGDVLQIGKRRIYELHITAH